MRPKRQPAILVITDNSRSAALIYRALERDRGRSTKPRQFYFKVFDRGHAIITVATNGHLQLFQNSSPFKWSGLDPRQMIEDRSSVIPVLNSFNKANFYSISKILSSENIVAIVLAMSPDVNGLTIMLKEVGNLISNNSINVPLKKLPMLCLGAGYIRNSIHAPKDLVIKDHAMAEMEYLRGYLDAVISFSITQEITYTVKKIMELEMDTFKDLIEVIKQDNKGNKNVIIPMSRAQALILSKILDNNDLMEGKAHKVTEKRWEIHVAIKNGKDKESGPFLVEGMCFTSEQEARDVFSGFAGLRHAKIDDFKNTTAVEPPPPPFTLTAIVKHTSSELGFPTTYSYKILTDLYYLRLITYPSLDDFTYTGLATEPTEFLDRLGEIEEFEDLAQRAREVYMQDPSHLQSNLEGRLENAIIPLHVVPPKEAVFKGKPNHWRIYSMILHRTLLQFFPAASLKETEVMLKMDGGRHCKFSTRAVEEEGYAKYLDRVEFPRTMTKSLELDMLASIDVEFSLVASTEDPAFYTDASLLEEIHELELGDTVSYLMMIEKLINNNYIVLVNKHLKVTKRGRAIGTFLRDTYSFLGTDSFTTWFTKELGKIGSCGSMDELPRVVEEVRETVLGRYLQEFDEARNLTNEFLKAKGFSQEHRDHAKVAPGSRFPVKEEKRITCSCGGPMRVIETRNGNRFLACENRIECGRTANLPDNGRIDILAKECALCKNKVVKVFPEKGSEYVFCPICWARHQNNEVGRRVGYCPSCEEMESCYVEGDEGEDLVKEIARERADLFPACPRCKESMMALQFREDGGQDLACENPLCDYHLSVPEPFIGKIEPTEKDCMICPMNAVLFKVDEEHEYHVCLHCYSRYLGDPSKEIGFCIGCLYHEACFNNATLDKVDNLPVVERVKQRFEEAAVRETG